MRHAHTAHYTAHYYCAHCALQLRKQRSAYSAPLLRTHRTGSNLASDSRKHLDGTLVDDGAFDHLHTADDVHLEGREGRVARVDPAHTVDCDVQSLRPAERNALETFEKFVVQSLSS